MQRFLGSIRGFVTMLAAMIVATTVAVAFSQAPSDPFNEASYKSITQPANHAETITIGGVDHDLDFVTQGIRNGGEDAVDVAVRMKSGENFIYRNIQPGATEPARIDKIYAAGTSAIDIDVVGAK